MKEAFVSAGPVVQIADTPIPEPGNDQVLIRVKVSGSNPKDWKYPEWSPSPDGSGQNQGDDIAGVVAKVGPNVTEFKAGDRVGAFHEMLTPHGSYAEYALAWQSTTFHIPEKTSFEETASLPLAAATAALALYVKLGLPQPWTPAPDETTTPLVVYGASTSVGSYALQLAQRSNIHPVIAIAGKSSAHCESLIDRTRGDVVLDYRGKTPEQLSSEIEKAAPAGHAIQHALDAISENGTWATVGRAMAATAASAGAGRAGPARLTTVLPVPGDGPAVPEGVDVSLTYVASVHKQDKDFGHVIFRYFGRALQQGWLRPQPQEVVPGGLAGVEQGLKNLKAGKANAVKYVFRIDDTVGVSA